jgi:hypothetical protein
VSCCSRSGYDRVFDERNAQKDLRRYRRRGLKRDSREAVSFLRGRGIDGATVLEVGGGIGAVQRELLDAGAVRAVNVELSHGYEQAAADLARGVEARVERRIGDFVAEPVDDADAVVLIRVVCCYPDAERMVGAAADHARRLLVLSFPVDNAVSRTVARVANVFTRRFAGGFQAYVHPHALLRSVAVAHGLRLVERRRGLVWHTAGFERAS